MRSQNTCFDGKKIIRVFPRKTNDENVRIDCEPNLFDQADEIHISVSFSYDIPRAQQLYNLWKHVAPIKIDGPAFGTPGGDFMPGLYLKHGYTITSRGCNNKCWFCSVWKREGKVRELPIKEGYNVLDDNLLACSTDHIDAVFRMLQTQKQKPRFTGGLEAKLLTPQIAQKLRSLRPDVCYFAYDTPNDLEPLVNAGKLLFDAGFSRKSHNLRCYVLCGYKGDTFECAEKRFMQAYYAGFLPMAMLYRDNTGIRDEAWRKWTWQWTRPITAACNCKKLSC